MNDKIIDLLLEQEEVSWKEIIYDLVKKEQMDPWNINITLLTQKYIEMVRQMQQHDLRISGKVLLAAAVLLKIKTVHLIDNDISKLDALINQGDELDEEMFEQLEDGTIRPKEKYALIPRNPQPRNRKVSIHDLVDALQRAMASKKRILSKIRPTPFIMPERNMDIMEVIRDIYHKLVYYSKKEKEGKITFAKLLPPRAGKQEKVYTFIPLLHLENQQKVEMFQDKPFEEIEVKLVGKEKKDASSS